MPSDVACPKCGTTYPWQLPRKKCKYCGTPLPRGTCYDCGRYFDKLNVGICSECNNAKSLKSHNKKVAMADKEYADWTSELKKLPTPYRFLTEDEWLTACIHFNGCAYCGADSIDARVMFIPRHRGGIYAKFNVLPSCEKCATAYNKTVNYKGNPFHYLECARSTVARQRMNKIKDFLHTQLKEYKEGR